MKVFLFASEFSIVPARSGKFYFLAIYTRVICTNNQWYKHNTMICTIFLYSGDIIQFKFLVRKKKIISVKITGKMNAAFANSR